MCPQNLGLNKMKEVSDGLQSQHIFRARSFIEIDSQASEQNPNLRRLRNEEFVNTFLYEHFIIFSLSVLCNMQITLDIFVFLCPYFC